MEIFTTFRLLFFSTLIFTIGCKSQESLIVADGAGIKLVSDGFEFTEGPAADGEGNVFFTDQPNNRILKWSASSNDVSVFMENAGRANGLYFDKDENLIACADENSELWKIDKDKNVTVLVNDFRGKKLNGPNDLWIDAKGGMYITDPYYERPYRDYDGQPMEEQRVYYLSPDTGELNVATEDLVKPNGIIGTPNGKTLYVADIEADKTWSFDIAEDGSLSNKTLFTEMGSDGMTIDNRGNIYLTGNGVTVFNPKGEQILHIPVEKDWTANVTFGGKNNQTLFITAMDSVFSSYHQNL
jgi:gluconolactonase